MQFTLEVALSAASALVVVGAGAVAWSNRDEPGATALVAFNAAAFAWTGGNAFQAAATTLSGKLLWVNVQYVGIAVLPVATLWFAAAFAERRRLTDRRVLAALVLPLAALVALSWTNGTHGLVRSGARLVTADGVVRLERSFGPAFFAGWLYTQTLNLLATAVLLRAVLFTDDLYRRQVAALLVGALVPWAGQLLFLADLSPFEPEVFFAVTGAAFVYAVSRYGLMDLFPVGRDVVIEVLDDGVIVVDGRGRVVDFNAAAADLLGSDPAVGDDVADALAAVDGLLSVYRGAVDGDGGGAVVPHGDRWLDVQVSPLARRGERVVVLRDVTALAQRERELERKNRRLEEFASVISHDLRGPLSVANGYVALERDERDSEGLAKAASALERMDDIIDDLLALTHAESVDDDVEPVDVRTLATEVWGHAGADDVDLVVEDAPRVEAAPGPLARALENLFRNAADHGRADVVSVGATDGGFYVADDGVGVDGAPENLFEWGVSADDGGGVGLAIVRRVAEAHGWTVRATEGDDDGARFEFDGVDHPT